MDNEHYVMISIDDSKSKVIADVLGNKTCKKIMLFLSENNEASEKDLSDKLHVPINTIEYNLNKLVESGFVQKKKNFFWSKKGKKIAMYGLSNKSIILSPKKSTAEKLKSILPAVILTLTGTFAVWVYEKVSIGYQKIVSPSLNYIQNNQQTVIKSALDIEQAVQGTINPSQAAELIMPNQFLWLYFLGGAFIALLVVSIINWRKL